VKFGFAHSKLRKQPFVAVIFKMSPPSDAHSGWPSFER